MYYMDKNFAKDALLSPDLFGHRKEFVQLIKQCWRNLFFSSIFWMFCVEYLMLLGPISHWKSANSNICLVCRSSSWFCLRLCFEKNEMIDLYN